ncbi:MAG: RnfABCDGE type electron transport complex subunit G [Paludibacter sp.]
MKRLKSNFLNMVLVLSCITLIAAYTLTSVYSHTKDTIQKSLFKKQMNDICSVLPANSTVDTLPVIIKEGDENLKVYRAYDSTGNIVGAAVESSSNNGYKSRINIMVGFDRSGRIINYNVLKHDETLGLGSLMQNWFRTGKSSILDRNICNCNLSVSKDGGDIDAITAATISSRAFLFAVRNAYFAFTSHMETVSKAQQSKSDSTMNVIESISKINKYVPKTR